MQDSEPPASPAGECRPTITLEPTAAAATRRRGQGSGALLGLSALGIVFGDIGTSPLYTLKTVLNLTGDHPGPRPFWACCR